MTVHGDPAGEACTIASLVPSIGVVMWGCVPGAHGGGYPYKNTRAENAHTAEKSDFIECPMLALTVRDHDAYRRPSWCSVRCDSLTLLTAHQPTGCRGMRYSSRAGPTVTWP